ncbi:DUF2267 domain-containing protein [Lichenibacterium minor]|jgi:hypothetical protein|uniref:DUF2267 domain-containing protein n=1 Tax=Lichenibacterium minor TaxID=2316528 RepID=A0A4Q2UCH5_9HYPH|nr:DUF2267 domain-containing protein [Lichenibacterium minor]RYC32951.1 DUF2267 domain-containing protein [Lichenibacterium minor]
MQDLIDHVSTEAGLEPATARKAIGIVLDFVQKNVPPDTSAAVIDRVPGARAAASAAAEDEAEGGGSATPGLMGLADRLMAEGVGMGAMQSLGRAMFEGLRRHVGDGPVDDVAKAIPELQHVM